MNPPYGAFMGCGLRQTPRSDRLLDPLSKLFHHCIELNDTASLDIPLSCLDLLKDVKLVLDVLQSGVVG
jgi:hypothetical protein